MIPIRVPGDVTGAPAPLRRSSFGQLAKQCLGVVFCFACFFPYVTPVPNSFDTQPYALLLGGVFVLSVGLGSRYPQEFLLIGIFVIAALVVMALECGLSGESPWTFVRACANYLSIAVLFFAVYRFVELYGIPHRLLIVAAHVWLIGALIQITNHPWIFQNIARVRVTEGRGMPSFAPEPTFYGIALILLAVLVRVSGRLSARLKVYLIFLCAFQAVVLAQSLMSVGLIILYVVLLVATVSGQLLRARRLSVKWTAAAIFLIAATAGLVRYLQPESRAGRFLPELVASPVQFFYRDASANARLGHIYLPVKLAVEDFGLPGGVATFSTRIEREWGGFFWWRNTTDNKILSYWSGIIYEMGLLSAIYFVAVFKLWKRASGGSRRHVAEFLFMLALLFAAVPVAHPMVYWCLVCIAFADELDKRTLPVARA